MENNVESFKSDLTRLIEQLIDFIQLKKREKLQRITVEMATQMLDMFQIKTIFSLAESSDEIKDSVYNALIRIEYKQFEALQQIRRNVQTCMYVLLEGSIKRIGRLFRMITNAFNRSYAYEQFQLNSTNRQQNLKIFSDQTGQSYKCLKKVKVFRLEKWLYDQILLVLTKNDRQLLDNFISKALKIQPGNLEDLHLENRIQIIEEKKGKVLAINQQCLYVIKKGLIQLYYPQSKIKIQLNDGSLLKFSKTNNFEVRIVQNTIFFCIEKKILKELYKECPHFEEDLNHQCEEVYKTRHQILTKSPRCHTQPENSPQYSYANMKLNPKGSKRFRKALGKCQNSHVQVKEFVSNLPYEKLIQSEEFVQKCKKEKFEIKKKKCDKITSYLKKIQMKKQKKHDRMFQLRMKSIADKAVVSNNANPIKRLRQSGILKFNFFDTAIDEEQLQNTGNSATSTTKQAFLSPSDTGIINSFIKNSRRYQCQISYLLNSSEKENNFIKPTKNEHKNDGTIFCHKMLKDMLKKYTQPNIQTAQTQFDETNNRETMNRLSSNRMSHQTATSPTYYNNFIEELLPLRVSQTNIVKKPILKRLKSGKIVRRF